MISNVNRTLALLLVGLVATALAPRALSRTVLGLDFTLSRNDLWRVINDVCVPASRIGLPFPCAKVVQRSGDGAGYAILPVSAGHILTVPTTRIAGIESRELLSPAQPNYWQAAWEARGRLDEDFGRKFDRGDVALALNSAFVRSQDQMHIHTACVRSEVKAALAADPAMGTGWSRLSTRLVGESYRVRWAPGADLSGIDVFGLLPAEVRRSPAAMARQTLVVVGGWDRNRAPGFYILDNQGGGGGGGHGESLLDFKCRL